MNIRSVLCALAFLPLDVLADGPFGIEIGAPISQYSSCSKADAPGMYRCQSVPKPHSEFEQYLVQASDSFGVCFIKGIGRDISDNGHGISTRSRAETIANQVSVNYGAHTSKIDRLMSGSIWDEPNDWLMGLAKTDRIFMYHWDFTEQSNKVNRIREIFVGAKALGSNTGYLIAEFYGDNYVACDAETQVGEASAF